jgi:hypothetical protein
LPVTDYRALARMVGKYKCRIPAQLPPIGLTAELARIARIMFSKFDSSFIPIYGYMVSDVSATSGRERPVLSKKKLMNIESSTGGLQASKFVIRYSAVRCLARLPKRPV